MTPVRRTAGQMEFSPVNINSMNFLILGANGLIGRQFVRLCNDRGYFYTGARHSRDEEHFIPFDLLDFKQIPIIFSRISPHVVVNCTGLAGGVDFCQNNPALGRLYHAESSNVMAEWCRRHQAAYVYISTDYVFDGARPPYHEDDPVNPLNLYGTYKLEGETFIRENLEKYVIARTTNVFGWDPETKTPNFIMALINSLKEKDVVEVPAYLFGNPTYAPDLAAGIMDLLENRRYGLYHIVGPGYINRYEWAVKCLRTVGWSDKTIIPRMKPPENMIPRPLTSNLDAAKFRGVSNSGVSGIEEGLEKFATDMKNDKRFCESGRIPRFIS